MHKLTTDEEAQGKVKEVFEEIRSQFGMVPNFFRAQAHVDPEWLSLNWQRWKTIMGKTGSLDRKTKELIAVTVSLINQCEYCSVAHEGAARMAGASDKDIIELKQVVELFCSFTNIANSLTIPLDKV